MSKEGVNTLITAVRCCDDDSQRAAAMKHCHFGMCGDEGWKSMLGAFDHDSNRVEAVKTMLSWSPTGTIFGHSLVAALSAMDSDSYRTQVVSLFLEKSLLCSVGEIVDAMRHFANDEHKTPAIASFMKHGIRASPQDIVELSRCISSDSYKQSVIKAALGENRGLSRDQVIAILNTLSSDSYKQAVLQLLDGRMNASTDEKAKIVDCFSAESYKRNARQILGIPKPAPPKQTNVGDPLKYPFGQNPEASPKAWVVNNTQPVSPFYRNCHFNDNFYPREHVHEGIPRVIDPNATNINNLYRQFVSDDDIQTDSVINGVMGPNTIINNRLAIPIAVDINFSVITIGDRKCNGKLNYNGSVFVYQPTGSCFVHTKHGENYCVWPPRQFVLTPAGELLPNDKFDMPPDIVIMASSPVRVAPVPVPAPAPAPAPATAPSPLPGMLVITQKDADDLEAKWKDKEVPKKDQCIVCFELPKGECLLIPCAHLNTCAKCALQVKTCPECRKVILQRLRVFNSISEEEDAPAQEASSSNSKPKE